MTITTRFAPSPTGDLHIGGARTALFNYLFAKAQGGKFLLRIEDTDRTRSTDQAVENILDALAWLELKPDADPVFQSHNIDAHLNAANSLIASKKAFLCHMNPEQIEAERAACHRDGRAFRSLWRDHLRESDSTDTDSAVIRLRAPDTGYVTINDAVRGQVSVRAADIDDMILARADRTPTYMLAVVVDDHNSRVSHVIRGDDHLTNAVRQAVLCDALGWKRPLWAHVPLIHGPDGKKLSKRHNVQSVTAYRNMGYSPEGICNYLLLLGFSHGNQEFFDRQQAIECFGLNGLGRSAARLDHAKLDAINAHHLRNAPESDLLDALEAKDNMNDQERKRISMALSHIKMRVTNMVELADAVRYLRQIRPLVLDPADRTVVDAVGTDSLTALVESINTKKWTEQNIAEALPGVCKSLGLRMGKVGPALRLCLAGTRSASALAAIMSWLGRDETLARIHDQKS